MGLLNTNDDFKIRISSLKEMGFKMNYWGSPDWYSNYKDNSINAQINRRYRTSKPHWKPSKKFYEYYDEDWEITYYYFPKKFDGYVNWDAIGFPINWNPDLSKHSIIIAYDESAEFGDSWRPVQITVKNMIDIEHAILEAQKRSREYYENYDRIL